MSPNNEALLNLPWVSAATPPEDHAQSNATFLVISAPVIGGGGRVGSSLYLAHYRGKGRWVHYQPNLPTDGHELPGVAVWLDANSWDLERIVAVVAAKTHDQ